MYALYSKKINRLYIGQTEDLDRRLREHHEGVSFYTKRVDDWKLIHSEDFVTRSNALNREKQLKSYRGRKFLRSLIPGGC